MAIFNKSVRYTKEQLRDHYRKSNSALILALRYLYGFFRFLCIIIQNLYCVSSYLVLSWIVLLPVSWIRSDIYSKLENYAYNSLLYIVSSWSLAADTTVVEAGDEFKHLIEESFLDSQSNRFIQCPNGGTLLEDTRETNLQLKRRHPNKLSSSRDLVPTHKFDTTVKNGPVDLNAGLLKRPNSSNEILPDSQHSWAREAIRGSLKNNENGWLNGLHKSTIDESNENGKESGNNPKNLNNVDDENESGSIEYEVVLASAAGERSIFHRSYKKDQFNDINRESRVPNRIHSGNSKLQELKKLTSLNSEYDSIKSNHSFAVINRNELYASPMTTNLNAKFSNSVISLKSVQAKPRILFLCNHISTADVPLIMQSFSTLTNHSLLWVLDAQFKPTNFGVVCSSHGDFFVAKNSFIDGSLREQVLKHPDRNILVLFPEGGFLRKRIDGSNRYAKRSGLPMTKYVTHPRFGAFKDLIDPTVGVTHIVDATLCYDDIKNPLSILDIAFGTRREPTILNYKLYKRSDVNPTEEWLRNIWLEKDKLLAEFYEERSTFLKRIETSMRIPQLDWLKILAVHLFYLLVCYLAIFRLFNATRITMLKARELYYSNM